MNDRILERRDVFALTFLILASLFLRFYLEEAHIRVWDHLTYYYSFDQKDFLEDVKWWEWFLPLEDVGRLWQNSTNVLAYQLHKIVPPYVTWVGLNFSVIVFSYVLAKLLSKSFVMAFTLALSFTFSTHAIHVYAVGGIMHANTFLTYVLLHLIVINRMYMDTLRPWLWRVAYGVTLFILAESYEGWIDGVVTIWVAMAIVIPFLRRTGNHTALATSRFIVVTSTLIFILYLSIKFFWYSTSHGMGSESDTVFNYNYLSLALEDILGNVITFAYKAVANFLPPFSITTISMTILGKSTIIAEQAGYHPAMQHLTYMNHVFFWRYFAGASFVAIVYLFVRSAIRLIRHGEHFWLLPALMTTMILTGSAVHVAIKFRPFHSIPCQTYNIMVAVLGAGLLLSFGTSMLWERRQALFGQRRSFLIAGSLVVLVWAIQVSNAFTRPPFLNAACAAEGMWNVHNPAKRLKALLRDGPSWNLPRDAMPLHPRAMPVTEPLSSGKLVYRLVPSDGQTWMAGKNSTDIRVEDAELTLRNPTHHGYQLTSPVILVEPRQRYQVIFDIDGPKPNLWVGVLDEKAGIWALQVEANRPGPVAFGFESPTPRLQIILFTNEPGANIRIRKLELRRVKALAD
ncbi:MAG: hypothetical protein HOL66_10495 [Rhodospirillaceae bacterium]|jgi:hypothetical protein|nr:hypothetical protein [Rhodospirillaceae bacterium]